MKATRTIARTLRDLAARASATLLSREARRVLAPPAPPAAGSYAAQAEIEAHNARVEQARRERLEHRAKRQQQAKGKL